MVQRRTLEREVGVRSSLWLPYRVLEQETGNKPILYLHYVDILNTCMKLFG